MIRTKITRAAAAALMTGIAVLGFAIASATPSQAATATEVVGQGSNKCLDLRREDGTTVQTWTCFGSPNQRWYVQFAGTNSGVNWFRFVSAQVPTQCMTVRGGGFANGTPVDVQDCGGGEPTQMFRLESISGSPSVYLHPLYTSKCIDVNGNSTGNGAKVQLWDCNGTTAQRFTFA